MSDSATVLVTVDFDGISSWINAQGNLPVMTSRGEFSVIGISRLLQTFEHFGVAATFFVPGHTAVTYPDLLRQILDLGHEIGHHGWMHESPLTLSRAEESAVLHRGIDAIRSVTNQRALGYRAPGWELSCHTVELLLEVGFEYDSSQMANDYVPYWCRVGDQHDPNGPYRFGSTVPLVEIPVSWHLDDGPYFEPIYDRHHQLVNPGLRSGHDVEAIWLDEWTYLTERAGGGAFVLTLHPEVIGRGYRMLMLERVLDRMTSQRNARFMRCLDFCREWKMTTPVPSSQTTHDPAHQD
jgi:peptidoglycan/xylan/chitin deacetylase (PgdA/CDA1 family)